LASKMPSMTAAALASEFSKDGGMEAEVDLIAAICRTQFVVTLGNLAGTIVASFLIDGLAILGQGHPFLEVDRAEHGVHSMHLLLSPTVLFAAMTGGFLWISSLAAGWAANWMALHRLPAAVGQSRRLRMIVGRGGARWLAKVVDHNFSGVIGYC